MVRNYNFLNVFTIGYLFLSPNTAFSEVTKTLIYKL